VRVFGRFIAGFLFLLFFFVFLFLSTVRFGLMNSSFLFFSLESNQVYNVLPARMAKALLNDNHLSQEEKNTYSQIVASVSATQMKEMIEPNVVQILRFLNGESQDITVRISAKQLSLPGKDLTGSLQTLSKERREIAQQLQGVGETMLVVILGIFLLLLLLLFFAGRGVLLTAGILTILLALAARIALWVVATNTPLLEPPQLLLVLMANSVLADIVLTWFIFGGLCIVFYIILGNKRFVHHKEK
jgi:hypothetical protein